MKFKLPNQAVFRAYLSKLGASRIAIKLKIAILSAKHQVGEIGDIEK